MTILLGVGIGLAVAVVVLALCFKNGLWMKP